MLTAEQPCNKKQPPTNPPDKGGKKKRKKKSKLVKQDTNIFSPLDLTREDGRGFTCKSIFFILVTTALPIAKEAHFLEGNMSGHLFYAWAPPFFLRGAEISV